MQVFPFPVVPHLAQFPSRHFQALKKDGSEQESFHMYNNVPFLSLLLLLRIIRNLCVVHEAGEQEVIQPDCMIPYQDSLYIL